MEHTFRKQATSNVGRWQQGGGIVTLRWHDDAPDVLTVRTRNGSQQWTRGDVQELVHFLLEFLGLPLALEE